MKVCVLTANLGNFDRPQKPVKQSIDFDYHCFTDEDFPPIAGLTPRLQYRIPKTHGWQMRPGYDIYVWLDGSMTLTNPDSLEWFINHLDVADMAIFNHPDRNTAREETDYIEARKDHPYLKSRYENGLHKEQMAEIETSGFEDDRLWASTVFAYRPTKNVEHMMRAWLYTSVRYFTCDQIALPCLAWRHGVRVNNLLMNPFKNPYLTVASKHS
jgi:hypothetical protein